MFIGSTMHFYCVCMNWKVYLRIKVYKNSNTKLITATKSEQNLIQKCVITVFKWQIFL